MHTMPTSEVAQREAWREMPLEERAHHLTQLPRALADACFHAASSGEQAELIVRLAPAHQQSFVRLLAPDDVADLVQHAPPERQAALVALLDERTRAEVTGLLLFAEDAAGGLMNPRYVRLRPDMTAREALSYVRLQADGTAETIYVAYVLDGAQQLLGVVSLRDLFEAVPDALVTTIMEREVVQVVEDTPQEDVSRLFADHHDLAVIPVVNHTGQMRGIVSLSDIVEVVQEEATEDIQKMGGMDTLERPYPQMGLLDLLKKRAGWLLVLFVGETFTATALGHYESQIDRATVLALFLTLINSAGGNSGSQSTALVMRALALGELRLRDWWLVCRRELCAGLALGSLLGGVGWLRVVVWATVFGMYGPHYPWIALSVGVTLVCVVAWGTVSGAMLPFIISRCGFDPATASGPFVATFVDVTAIVIYFSVAQMFLRGILL